MYIYLYNNYVLFEAYVAGQLGKSTRITKFHKTSDKADKGHYGVSVVQFLATFDHGKSVFCPPYLQCHWLGII